MIIALDGPAGSGKSTLAKILSEKLGIPYIDTGIFYRCVSLFAIRKQPDQKAIVEFTKNMSIDILRNRTIRVMLNGEDVTDGIRTPEVSKKTSEIADMKEVRIEVNKKLRSMAQITGGILDGRDIQTLVFPEADYKFFIIADVKERAERRLKDYNGMGIEKDLNEVMKEIAARDERDETREYGPLKKSTDAVVIDTSGLNIDEVVERILNTIKI